MQSVDRLTHPTISRVGFWSALLSAIFGLLYLIAEAFHLMGMLGEFDSATSFIYRMTPSLFLAIVFTILMVSIHQYASDDKKIWSQIALAFTVIYAVLVSITYFVVLTVLVPFTLRGEADQISVLAFGHGTLLFAIDVLGYGFMSLATLFASAVFQGQGIERWIKRALIANGIIAPAISLQIVYPPLWLIAALWGITFPAATILLAVFFRKTGQSA